MSVASITNPSLCSSSLPRSKQRRQNPLLSYAKSLSLSDPKPLTRGNQQSSNFAAFVIRVSSSETESEKSKSEGGEGEEEEGGGGEEEEKYEEYEVEIEKPYGLRFTKGRDGSTYIDAIAPGSFADKTGKFTVGDKVIATRSMLSPPLFAASTSPATSSPSSTPPSSQSSSRLSSLGHRNAVAIRRHCLTSSSPPSSSHGSSLGCRSAVPRARLSPPSSPLSSSSSSQASLASPAYL